MAEAATIVLDTNTTTHLAWIDFGIFHMMKNNVNMFRHWLHKIAGSNFNTKRILSPSCYTMELLDPFNEIYWNHCGSFLLGHTSLFQHAYNAQLSLIKQNLPKLTWEFNYWGLMGPTFFEPYYAVHDLSILENVCKLGN
jgi:hypothetical protein